MRIFNLKTHLVCIFFFVCITLPFYGETMNKHDLIINDLTKTLSPHPFMIPESQVREITKHYKLHVEELLQILVPVARSYARPPISNYKAAAVALGKSGNIYLGVNLEFLSVPLNEAIHCEQFAITNARAHQEREIVAIALSAAPCGHCRQFLNEMAGSENLRILTPDSETLLLSSLLPKSFGPQDLGLSGDLLTVTHDEASSSSLIDKAVQAALASYAPYSKSKSAVVLKTKNGAIYTGSYLENVAFNPSISPLQAALILLVANGLEYSDITEALLVEERSAKISQEVMSREILRTIAPDALFRIKKVDSLCAKIP